MADFTKTVSGWNPWRQLATKINGVEKLDAPFPPIYTPASAFWVQSLINHCDINWLVPLDPLSAFFLGGGTTFTVLGSVAGTAAASEIIQLPSFAEFGWGLQYAGPEMGYCIDSLFKQHLYVRFTVINDLSSGTIVVPSSYIELLQNYRTKRIYVHHGSVIRYVKVGDEHILTLDIEQDDFIGQENLSGETITIFNNVESGQEVSEVTVSVLDIKSNWDLVISDPGDGNTINSGDFYILSEPWCIEDPYLLSGFWSGTENDLNFSGPTSGYDLFVTTHTKPYIEGTFTGVYIYKNTETANIAYASPGTSFKSSVDEGSFDWMFYGFGNFSESNKYSNDTRYKEYLNEDNQYEQFEAADEGYYDATITSENIPSIRVELSNCGSIYQQNFYYNSLTGQYIKVNDKYFKILAQVTSDILDVSKISVDGSTEFNPKSNSVYSILNHKGWFITEHYDGHDLANSTGVFRGNMSVVDYDVSLGETSVILNVISDSSISWRVYRSVTDKYLTENNFIYRYRETYPGTSPKKMYEKFLGWKLVFPNNNTEYEIIDLKFVNPPTSHEESLDGYSIELKIEGDVLNLDGTGAYISFGDTFDTYGNFSKESGYDLDVTYTNAAENPPSAFIVSDKICMDGRYLANPYLLDIPLNGRVSVCGGYLFGLDSNGSAISNSDLMLLVTTPTGGRGIASLFHTLREEGWLIYVDPNTNRMTVRRGSLGYKEYPIKSEIAIGKYESTSSVGDGSVISLDTSKERLRRLSFTLPNSNKDGDYLMFGIGVENNLHGFIVSGDGVVNLQAFGKLGIDPTTVDSSDYTTSDGQKVSPVYVYKQGLSQYATTMEVDIAANIEDGENQIYIINGEVENTTAQYIADNQTMEDPGLFDVVRLKDGEVLVIYGQDISDFKIDGNDINTGEWVTPKGAMVIGTFDDDFYWGTPLKKGFNNDESVGSWQYPLMIMNNVEYYSSIYNPLNDTIMIFVRAINDGKSYIGGYTVPIRNFLHQIYLAIPEDSSSTPFLWRPPVMEDSFLDDFDKSWLEEGSRIEDDYSYEPSTDQQIEDTYVRVLGPESLNCQVVSGQELDLISTSIMPDGTYLMIYDSAEGVKMAFSTNNGRTWTGSDVIVSREGRGGVLVDHYLFYITAEGIEIKYTDWEDIYQLRTISQKKEEGNDVDNLEENMQNRYDVMEQDLIGSGIISFQRLSGYVTPEGIIKVFYYGDDSELVCMESSNARSWNIAANF